MASNPNERLIASIGMMDSTAAEHDGEAVNAFRVASRMLKSQGLSWRELAERALGAPGTPPPATTQAGGAPAGRDFANIFDGIFNQTFQQPPPRPRAPSRYAGADVPDTIVGIVRVIDADRRAKTGPMLVLEIVGTDAIWGPLVCFSEPVQTVLRRSVSDGMRVGAIIQKPRTEGQMAVVVSANIIAD